MADSYQIVFKWPSTSASHVVVTGTFDNWSQSVPLTRTGSAFEATVSVPWDTDIAYKFVVDGQWLIDHQQPQQYDGSGAVNNFTRTPTKPEPPISEPEPEPQPAAESEADKVDEPTPAEPIAKQSPVTVQEPQALDPASVVPEETAALIASAELSPPTNGLVNGSAEPAVESKDFVAVKPAAAPEVVPLVPEVQHATDPVPEAAAAVEGPAAPRSDVPVVELLPSHDALPVAQPVEEAAVAVASPDTGAEPTTSTELTPAAENVSSPPGEDVAAAAAPLTDAAAPVPSGDLPAKVDDAVTSDEQVTEADEARPPREAAVSDTSAPFQSEDVPAAVVDEASRSNGKLATDDGPHHHAPAVEADAAPAELAPVTEAEAISIPSKNAPTTVEEPAVTPLDEVKEATPSATEPPVTDAVAPIPADDVAAKVDEAVSKAEEAPAVSDALQPVAAAEPAAAPALAEEATAGPRDAATTPPLATTSEPLTVEDAPSKPDETAVKTGDSPAAPASDTAAPAASQNAPTTGGAVPANAEELPAKVESLQQPKAEAPPSATGAKDASNGTEAKPRLNGKGTVKDKEKRRSRTMSGFGTLKGKLFPTAPSPTEENPEFGEIGESKAAEDTAVEPRPKRQSIFGRMRNVSLKNMFKSS